MPPKLRGGAAGKDDSLERDDTKAATNWRDHGITFEMAGDAFKDASSIDWIDDRQDTAEERLSALAVVGDRLLHGSYTPRGDKIRMLSARKAEPRERRRYHNENRET
jgi:uncharacterized DUF497 family protein